MYDVKFPDGEVKEYSANVIAENLLSQVDSEGFTLTVFDSILEYARDDAIAVPKDEFYVPLRVDSIICAKPPVDGSSWYFGRMGQKHGFL